MYIVENLVNIEKHTKEKTTMLMCLTHKGNNTPAKVLWYSSFPYPSFLVLKHVNTNQIVILVFMPVLSNTVGTCGHLRLNVS